MSSACRSLPDVLDPWGGVNHDALLAALGVVELVGLRLLGHPLLRDDPLDDVLERLDQFGLGEVGPEALVERLDELAEPAHGDLPAGAAALARAGDGRQAVVGQLNGD